MLRSLRELLAIMRSDPTIASELPIVRSLSLRTFKWMLIAEIFLTLPFVAVKLFVDEVTTSNPDPVKLLGIASLTLVTFVLGVETRRISTFHRSKAFWRMWRVWWGYGNRQQLRLSSDWHTAHGTGEKESLLSKNISRFENMVDVALYQVIPASLRIVVSVVVMSVLGWQYGLFAVATCVAFGLVLWRSGKMTEEPRKQMHKELKHLERRGTELSSNWRTIKAMGREEDFADANEAKLMEFWHNHIARNRIYARQEANQLNTLALSRAMLYATVALIVVMGEFSLGATLIATALMARAYENFDSFGDLQRSMNEGLFAMKELISIMSLPPTVRQSPNPIWPEEAKGQVTFDGLSFAYPDNQARAAIDDFSLKVEPFTTTALVGPSGSGKSTLMSLLQREHDPSSGRILIDGIDLKEIDYGRYRREMIGVVSQNIELFDDTIIENIRLSKPDATDEEVIAAAKAAHAHEFITELKHGYATMVGEDGIRLSGGQRQRVAIARALLRQPAILILDEATSALDPESQAIVQQALNELIAARKLTIFIVAHRFSTIMTADQVVVMQKGKLAEVGTHAQLEKRNGLYARLRQMESDGLLG